MLTQTSPTRSTELKPVNASLPGHILLVEDDAAIRYLVMLVLEEEGYVVTARETTAEATRLLDRVRFDLVITDGFGTLPGDSFVNTADMVRHAALTPVVLFSAHTYDLGVARIAGFRDLITKPFDLEMLVHQVEVVLAGERLRLRRVVVSSSVEWRR